jgi:hypothetical protein
MRGSKGGEYNMKDYVPGPGQYKPNTNLVQTSIAYGYTFGGRTSVESKGNGVPPPGTYQIPSTIDKKHASSFGTAKKGNLSNSETFKVPGPGAYGVGNVRSGSKFG